MDGCPSTLKLSLSLVEGELAAEARAELEAHLSACSRCRQRLEELREERRVLYERRPSVDLSDGKPRLVWRRPILAGACACLLLLVGLVFLWPGREPPSGVRFKGEAPSLLFRVERGGQVFPGRSPASLHPGDRVRFAYTIDEDAYLYIVSVDNRGRVSAYYPAEGGESLAIAAGTEVFLPGSIRLDEYIGKERVYALFTRERLRFGDIESAVRREWRRAGDIEGVEALPLGAHQETVLITKAKADE